MKSKITLKDHLELAHWINQAREFFSEKNNLIRNTYGKTSRQGAESKKLMDAIGEVSTLMDDQMFLDYPGENDGFRYYGPTKRYTFTEFLELHLDDQDNLGEAARAWRDDDNPNKPKDPYEWEEVRDYLVTERDGEDRGVFLAVWRLWEHSVISLRRSGISTSK